MINKAQGQFLVLVLSWLLVNQFGMAMLDLKCHERIDLSGTMISEASFAFGKFHH